MMPEYNYLQLRFAKVSKKQSVSSVASSTLKLYKFTRHYILDNSRTSCQFLAFMHNISAVSRFSIEEVRVIIRLSF